LARLGLAGFAGCLTATPVPGYARLSNVRAVADLAVTPTAEASTATVTERAFPTPAAMSVSGKAAATVIAPSKHDCAFEGLGQARQLPTYNCVLASDNPDVQLARCSVRTDPHRVLEIEQLLTV
jgi:hypothetical protein